MPEIIRNLGLTRLIIIVGVTLSVVVFFVFLANRVSRPDMALLYKELELDDAGRIVQMLEQRNVRYELRNNGTEILVPRDTVARMRMAAAEEGLPFGGNVGYEIFDRTDALGTTSFVQNVNLLRALEGELARTITSLNRVSKARVHIVLPKRKVFQKDNQKPSASIMLTVRGSLDGPRVLAIQNLVAAAVAGLEPAHVAVIDSRGNLLSRVVDSNGGLAAPGSLQELRVAKEQRIKLAVESLLERTIGPGKVLAEVSAELNHDRITTNTETYDPEGQVIRSTQLREEKSESSEGDNEQAVTVANNLPDGQESQGQGSNSKSSNSVSEETTNFEITRETTTLIREAGLVKRLSIAVLVDGTYTPAAEEGGQPTYVPRSAEELDQLTKLVQSAIGFDAARGDTVELQSMRFVSQDIEEPEIEKPFEILGMQKDELIRMAEMAVLAVIALLVMLFVVRPMMNRVLNADPDGVDDPALALISGNGTLALSGAAGGAGGAQMLAGGGAAGGGAVGALSGPGGGVAALPGPGGGGQLAIGGGGAAGEEGDVDGEAMISMDQVEGRVKESSLRKIADIVEKHPEEAVAILRNWLYQDQ